MGQIGANHDKAYYYITTNALILINYCKSSHDRQKICPVKALFCAVYAEEMTCYCPAAERTYTYPKTTFTRRYEYERITLHTGGEQRKQMTQVKGHCSQTGISGGNECRPCILERVRGRLRQNGQGVP